MSEVTPSAGASPTPFEFSGGDVALDFANTVSGRRAKAEDLLAGYDDLVRWAEEAGLASAAAGHRLRRDATRHPRGAQAVLRRARTLREAIFTLFFAVGRRAALPPDALATLNGMVPKALARRRLVRAEDGGAAWGWVESDAMNLDRMLWPVVLSAAELLVSPRCGRVRVCEADTCAWLFLDLSRNRSRRWCDMATCGNRSKVRRFREAHRHGRGDRPGAT